MKQEDGVRTARSLAGRAEVRTCLLNDISHHFSFYKLSVWEYRCGIHKCKRTINDREVKLAVYCGVLLAVLCFVRASVDKCR